MDEALFHVSEQVVKRVLPSRHTRSTHTHTHVYITAQTARETDMPHTHTSQTDGQTHTCQCHAASRYERYYASIDNP
jgi:hypothetical protein